MKNYAAAVAFAFLAAGVPAFAADEHGAHGDGAGPQEARPMHAGRGKVVAVDVKAGTVKIAHDPIASLRWNRMTMDFKVQDAAMLDRIEPGMLVKFELMKMGGVYHIMGISPEN